MTKKISKETKQYMFNELDKFMNPECACYVPEFLEKLDYLDGNVRRMIRDYTGCSYEQSRDLLNEWIANQGE